MNVELLHSRVTELETRLEFQDQTIAQLNEALVAQQQKIFALEKTTKILVAQFQSRLADTPDPGAEPPPPHY